MYLLGFDSEQRFRFVYGAIYTTRLGNTYPASWCMMSDR
jgi:hypothetical protein